MRLPRRPLRLAGALDGLLVVLGAEELLRPLERGVGGRGVRPDAHCIGTPSLFDRAGGVLDLRLGLAGQADVLAGQPLGLLEIGACAADLVEHPHPLAVRLRQIEPDLVEDLGGRSESLVRGRPVLATARQQVGQPLQGRPRTPILVGQLLVGADVDFRLVLGDGVAVHRLGQSVPESGPVGPRLVEGTQDRIPARAAPGRGGRGPSC